MICNFKARTSLERTQHQYKITYILPISQYKITNYAQMGGERQAVFITPFVHLLNPSLNPSVLLL